MPQQHRRPALLLGTIAAGLLVALLQVVSAFAAGSHGTVGAVRGPTETLEGEVVLLHGDDFGRGRASFQYKLYDGRRYVALDVSRVGRPTDLVGKHLRLEGARRNGTFVVERVTPSRKLQATTAPTADVRRVAVLLLNFSNDRSQPWTRETVAGVLFGSTGSVNAYYGEVSYGQTVVQGDVLGWYPIPWDNSGCRFTDWAAAAEAAATAAGVNLAAYTNVMYAFPRASSCGWAGMAALRGRQSWINGSMTVRTLAHELGHNFGAHHASSLTCTSAGSRVTLSATCTRAEYGDPFTVMGSSTRHQHQWHRAQIGWLPDVQTVSAGDFSLAPVEFGTAPRLLRVARGDGSYLYLEFRQPFGAYDAFAPGDPVVNGVTVRLAPDFPTLSRSDLLDMTTGTTSFSDAPLMFGQTFTDPATGISITTLSVASTGATVRVGMGSQPPAPGDTQAPTAPAGLSASATSPTQAALTWGAATDNVGVSGYRVYRGGALVATTTTTSYSDAGLTPATTYSYAVVAFDAAGNVSAQATASVTTPSLPPASDVTPPSAPTGLTATPGKGKKIALAWSASTDEVGVAGYRVYRNGTQAGTTTQTSFLDTPPGKAGSVTYYVVAFDAAGNVSAPSSAVST